MSHKGRIWFVECLNMITHSFLVRNIEDCTDMTKIFDQMEVCVDGKLVRRNLVEIDWEGVKKLKSQRKGLCLQFNIFMKESRGAKATQWVM